MEKNSKILVTGGAGFIGSHVCEAFLDNGYNVACVDDFNKFYNPKIKEKNLYSCFKNKNFTLYRSDITHFDSLESIFLNEKPQKVIHIAARAGVRPSVEYPRLYSEVNIGGTLNLLELSKKYGVKNFILASSSSVYGNNKSIPFFEDNNVDHPISPYAASKRAAEMFGHTFHHLFGMNIVVLRFFTVFGPRGRPDMAPFKFAKLIYQGRFIEKYGDGTSKRDYTYVSDIVDGILASLDIKGYEIINLGNNHPVKLDYFISTIEELLNKKAKIKQLPIPPGDVNVTYADISKAYRILQWKPKVSFEQGMEKFIGWFKNEAVPSLLLYDSNT